MLEDWEDYMYTEHSDYQPKKYAVINEDIPVLQMEGVTDEQAGIAADTIVNAYIYINELHIGSFDILKECLKEIQIVKTIDDKELKYDLYSSGNKFVLRTRHDISYTEACNSINHVIMTFLK